jgi:ribosomal protein S6--L-glutamate ligase
MKIAILSRKGTLYSTRRLAETITKKGHEGLIVDHTKCYVSMEKGKPDVIYQGKSLADVDAIIPRIGASVTLFGAAIVRQFEMMKVFCVNGSMAIVRSRDKLRSLQILAKSDLGVPKTTFAKHPKDDDILPLIQQVGGAPVIIKLLEGTQGLGVVLAETQKAAKSVVEAFSGLKANILIQEFVAESKGCDIRAFVVGGEVVGAMKRTGKEGEFRSNIHRGGKGETIALKKNERSAVIKAASAMGLNVSGVDLIQSNRGSLILEVNSSPGLEGIEKATDVDIADKIVSYIEQHVKEKGKRRHLSKHHV